MIHSFTAVDGTRHTLDLDVAPVDGMDCTDIRSDGNREVSFETAQGTVACDLESFWHEIAGPTLSAREAALLLAECLARQITLARQEATLREITRLLSQVREAAAPSLGWLTTRLDPLARQAMDAYDGSDAVTEMLARILHQSPATIQIWARQLGLDALAQPEEATVSFAEVETEPLPALVPAVSEGAEPVAETTQAKQPFSWTLERRQQLEQALTTCTGSTVVERARQIAYEHNWPVMAVRSKLYEIQRPERRTKQAARESEQAEQKEGDQHADQREAVPV